jgi:hypothetical protein
VYQQKTFSKAGSFGKNSKKEEVVDDNSEIYRGPNDRKKRVKDLHGYER